MTTVITGREKGTTKRQQLHSVYFVVFVVKKYKKYKKCDSGSNVPELLCGRVTAADLENSQPPAAVARRTLRRSHRCPAGRCLDERVATSAAAALLATAMSRWSLLRDERVEARSAALPEPSLCRRPARTRRWSHYPRRRVAVPQKLQESARPNRYAAAHPPNAKRSTRQKDQQTLHPTPCKQTEPPSGASDAHPPPVHGYNRWQDCETPALPHSTQCTED